MKNLSLFFLITFLSIPSILFSCICFEVKPFCTNVNEESIVIEAEVIEEYYQEGVRYLDFKITDELQNAPSFEFFSAPMLFSCNEGWELVVGDKIVVLFWESNSSYAPDANYIMTEFSSCVISYLTLSSDGTTLEGWVEEDKFEIVYEDFKSSLGDCNSYDYTYEVELEPEAEVELPFLKLFPNPTNSLVTLSFGEIEIDKIDYQLFSSDGKEILRKESIVGNVLNIDMTNYPIGVYFLRVNYNGEEIIERIVKY